MITIMSDSFFDELKKRNKYSLIYFAAEWCKPCAVLAPVFQTVAASGKYKDVGFFKVDADLESGLVDKFGVESLPTVVLIRGDELIHMTVGTSGNAQKMLEEILKFAS